MTYSWDGLKWVSGIQKHQIEKVFLINSFDRCETTIEDDDDHSDHHHHSTGDVDQKSNQYVALSSI